MNHTYTITSTLCLLLISGCTQRESVSRVSPLPGKPVASDIAVPTPAPAPAPVAIPELPPSGSLLTKAGFPCKVEMLSVPATLKAGGLAQKIKVKVTNQSAETWPNLKKDKSSRYAVNIGYHWLDASGKDIKEGSRAYLPEPLSPGQSVEVEMAIESLPSSGEYLLKVEPVQEAHAWFSNAGGCSAKSGVTISQ